jgi:hypothetical protein
MAEAHRPWPWAGRGASIGAVALEELKTLVDLVQAVVTTVGFVIAGVWTYFKFIKGREFRPHLEITVHADWLGDSGEPGLRLRIELKNIGTAKVQLVQRGTGVMVSRLADGQAAPPAVARWTDLGVYEVFTKHEWVEPGETIGDDLLLRLALPPQVLEIRTRVVLAWRPNIEVQGRHVVAPEESRTADRPSGHKKEVP